MTATSNHPPLLERESELERIEGAVGRAADGDGGMLLIEAAAGIGKTSLLDAARRMAASRGMQVLAARATELEREFPYGAIRQLLERRLVAATPPERERWFAGSAAGAAAVSGLALAGSTAPEPGVAALNSLYWLLANLAEDDPCLVALDDAQWADPDSLRFLGYLAPRLSELPVLVVIAARTGEWEPTPELAATASDPAGRPLLPSQLSPAATAAVLGARLDRPATPGFAQACHEATGGNPFYLHALLDVLADDRIAPVDANAAQVLGLGPRTVAGAIVARLAQLSPEAAALARAAAVLGDRAPLEHAAELAAVEVGAAGAAADGLAAAAILAPERPLRFLHPIIRNAIYDDIGRTEREGLHHRAVAMLSAMDEATERIAAHLLALPPAGDPTAVAVLRAAGAEALDRGASDSAVAHLRRALAEPPGAAERGSVLFELGAAELSRDPAAAIGHLREALDLAAAPAHRVPIALALTGALTTASETGAVAILRGELDRLGDGDGELAATLESQLLMSLAIATEPELVREARSRTERLEPTLTGADDAERQALDCLALCRLARNAPAAEVAAPALLRLRRTPSGGIDDASAPHWLLSVVALFRAGEIEQAERWAERMLDDATASRSPHSISGAQCMLGNITHRRGQLAEAVAWLETSLRGAREFGFSICAEAAMAALVEVRVERGELAEAAAALAAVELDGEHEQNGLLSGELLESRARLRLAEGDVEAALEYFAATADHARRRGGLGPGMTAWRSGMAQARLRLGDREEARRLAGEELVMARRLGARRPLGIALQAAALASEGEEGIELLREGVSVLDGSPIRLEHARSLVELGAALRRSGERSAARGPLGRGLEIARACGATPLVERAYTELRAAGARPRKILYTGLESLTPSEGRVARLAARGMRNREIAQELFVSVKTVESHLGSAYVKLEIHSRSELSAALGDDD